MGKSSETFTYELPGKLEKNISVGMRVEVPLGRRRQIGLIVNTHRNKPKFTTRPIIDSVEASPLVSKEQLEFWSLQNNRERFVYELKSHVAWLLKTFFSSIPFDLCLINLII